MGRSVYDIIVYGDHSGFVLRALILYAISPNTSWGCLEEEVCSRPSDIKRRVIVNLEKKGFRCLWNFNSPKHNFRCFVLAVPFSPDLRRSVVDSGELSR